MTHSISGSRLFCNLHAQIIFSSKKQQLCIDVLLEPALHLQQLLTSMEGSRGDPFQPEIYEQVDQTIWAERTLGKVDNI